MSSIGPQLPPHLSKRKRTPEDESPESPAAKLRATSPPQVNNNKDEINIDSDDDDDDDDGYGTPAPQSATQASIGPTLPPSNTAEINLDDSDEDDIGPSAPPPPASTRPSIGPTLPPSSNQDEIPLDDENNSSSDDTGPAPGPALPHPAPSSTKRVLGPAPPPAPLSERPTTSPPNPDESSDDDDYGPALPTSTSHLQRQTQARAAEEAARAAEAAAGPKRDDWMLAPPTASGYRAPDPTKLKSRRFASGPRASGSGSTPSAPGGEISSIWTETPEQKRKRLENAVLGRGDDSSSSQMRTMSGTSGNGSGNNSADAPPSKEALEQQERVRSYTEATRGRSLYEEHRASRRGRELRADEEEDDPSRRAFDREKDMKLGGRIGSAQRRELLNRAADFGGRFAKGKYL
ncbi:uncharacterized protein F4812DRAFT_443776 [Daldinia caldariorum]|uniref:uncharacterized protein n=1 Tax=Daldinia caldariorum TaxID=326644 RepID=UPI0020079D8C|nr:uncharacterized protein F4812DRAFT_443776 [Daldinia caldariorum]KAI1464205.1 hypothetical protein F4812DRAFT_443776 [Daldinia caldariorum]